MNNKNQRNNPFQRLLKKYAIPNLSLVIILCYGFGYLLQFINSSFLDYLTLNPYAICHGQIWRLLTWVLVPPSTSNLFFILIAMMFYYSIGTSLEQTWGTYAYNAYIWLGIFITIVGAFVTMLVYYGMFAVAGVKPDAEVLQAGFAVLARYFSTYYVNMSIFLAYAATFPNAVVLLWFIIPIKVKWMGVVYGVLLGFDFIQMAAAGRWYICIAMGASLMNFLIFFLRRSKITRFTPGEMKRRSDFRRSANQGKQNRSGAGNAWNGGSGRFSGTTSENSGSSGQTSGTQAAKMHPQGNAGVNRHRCAICGKTELDDPTLEFRYCSKCRGTYEFCQEHLFHHQHAVNGAGPILTEETVTVEPVEDKEP